MNEQRNEPLYSEWVLPSWTSFIPVLAVYPTLWITFLPINPVIGVWAGIGLTFAVIAFMVTKSARIAVSGANLQVGNAQIDRKFISSVEVIEPEAAFAARGRDLDPGAWIHFQGSVKSLVRVNLNDPDDPTPYWLFSTRNPAELKDCLGF
jgi:Protein of unknown function (DUF3093)